MKNRPGIFFLYRTGYRIDVIDSARFIVHVHYGNQRSFFVHQSKEFFDVYPAVGKKRCKTCLRGTPVFQFRHGRYNRGMFPFRRHDDSAPSVAENCLIVRLRAAGGKNKLKLLCIRDLRKQSRASLFQLALQSKTFTIQTGRIKIIGCKVFLRPRQSFLLRLGRRGIIQIYHNRKNYLFCAFFFSCAT